MAGGTLTEAREKGMVFILMTGTEVGVIARMAGDACAALTSIDTLIRGLQGASSRRVNVTSSAAIATLVVDGEDVHGVVRLASLIVA